jgi:hypothetical protein
MASKYYTTHKHYKIYMYLQACVLWCGEFDHIQVYSSIGPQIKLQILLISSAVGIVIGSG